MQIQGKKGLFHSRRKQNSTMGNGPATPKHMSFGVLLIPKLCCSFHFCGISGFFWQNPCKYSILQMAAIRKDNFR